jgi:hypothetical protein
VDLINYDGKYVCIKDIYGNTFSGRARYGNADFLECEWGQGRMESLLRMASSAILRLNQLRK